MANDSLAHHHLLLLPFAADGCSDAEDVGTATVAFPSFWPPFPPLSPDSDSGTLGFVTTPRSMDRSGDREAAAASAAFFGLGFRDVDGDEWAPPDGTGEVELPLCWDCLGLEDHDDHLQRWDADGWEQVAAREEEAAAARMSGLEWEVLLQATNSLGSLVVDDDDDDLEGSIGTYFLDEDDALFEQIAAEAGHEPPAKGGRPAAKAVVDGLPTVVVAEADDALCCAVCKDGVEAGDRARRLPCAHLYHDGCILPWLAVRNTCPLCRHELPTDDPEYEKWKARRAAGGGGEAGLRGATAAGTITSSSGYLGEWIGSFNS